MSFSDVETVLVMTTVSVLVIALVSIVSLIGKLSGVKHVKNLAIDERERLSKENTELKVDKATLNVRVLSRETERQTAEGAYKRENTERLRLKAEVEQLHADRLNAALAQQAEAKRQDEFKIELAKLQADKAKLEESVSEVTETLGKRILTIGKERDEKVQAFERLLVERDRAANSYNALYDAYWNLRKKVETLAGEAVSTDAGIEPKFGSVAGGKIEAGDFVVIGAGGLARPFTAKTGNWLESLGTPVTHVDNRRPDSTVFVDPTIPGECLGASLDPSGDVLGFISRDEAGKLSVVG